MLKKRRNHFATEQNQVQLASILQAPEFIVPQGVSVKFDPLRIFFTPIFIEVIAFFGQPYDPYRGRRGRAEPRRGRKPDELRKMFRIA